MKKSVVIAVSLAVVSLLVLISGLTGMATVNLGQPYCDSDDDCPVVCCKLYNQDNGVCDKPSNCNSIKLLSMEQTKSISSATLPRIEPSSNLHNFLSSKIQFQGNVSIVSSIFASLILLILSLFILIIGNRRGI